MPDKIETEKHFDFFVSYTQTDVTWARWIAWVLEDAGYKVIFQEWDILPGHFFMIEMDNAAKETKKTIAVLSTNYEQSKYAKLEAMHANSRDPDGSNRQLIPVLVQPCDSQGFIGDRVHINLIGISEDDAREKLLNAVKVDGRAKPPEKPPFPGQDSNPRKANNLTDEVDTGESSQVDRTLAFDISRSTWLNRTVDFFDERLAKAFPGIHGVKRYEDAEAIKKLTILLKSPLSLPTTQQEKLPPLWKFRGGTSMPISSFKISDPNKNTGLLGLGGAWYEELNVASLVVYRSRHRAFKDFVYVEVKSDTPTEYFEVSPELVTDELIRFGYAREAVGYWKNRYVSRYDLEDGYTEVDGRIVNLDRAEQHIRYLTPYNFIITSQASVINSGQADSILEPILNGLIQGSSDISKLLEAINNLRLTEKMEYHIRLLD